MNPNEAKIIGHLEADGSISNNRVGYYNKNAKLMRDFIRLFEETFNCKYWKIYENKTSLETGCAKKRIVKEIKAIQKKKKELFNGRKSAIEFIKANFDDECTIILIKRERGYDGEIKMWSLDKERLSFIVELLFLHLGIKAKIYGPRKEKYYELKIMNKKDLKIFCENIKLEHPNKNTKQKKLLDSIN